MTLWPPEVFRKEVGKEEKEHATEKNRLMFPLKVAP
jgi:hypothetical protein